MVKKVTLSITLEKTECNTFSFKANNKNKGEIIMDKLKDYVAADLSSNLVSEIKSLEEKLSEQANKEVVVIAYQKEE